MAFLVYADIILCAELDRCFSFASYYRMDIWLMDAYDPVAWNGHSICICDKSMKYCRYGSSAIACTSLRSERFSLFCIIRAPYAVLNGKAGLPFFDGNMSAYVSSRRCQSICPARFTLLTLLFLLVFVRIKNSKSYYICILPVLIQCFTFHYGLHSKACTLQKVRFIYKLIENIRIYLV